MSITLRHVGIVVADLDAALNFWCDLLGFAVRKRLVESGPFIDKLLGLVDVEVTTVKLADEDENQVELLCFHSHPDSLGWRGAVNTTGLTHIALTVKDLEWTHENLSAKGVKFFAEPQKSPDGNVKVVYASGPENLLIEFVEEMRN